MSAPVYSVRTTLGALEAGGFVSIFLSGVVTMQSYLYYRVYPKDATHIKSLVAALWLLDITHTVLICVSNWTYLVIHFGNSGNADHILTTVAVTIALTAIITFIVHAFFIHRIYVVSNSKAIIAIPLIVLALFRLGAALVSTGEMIRLGSFSLFRQQYEYVFTMGLSAAVALDISVTLGLSYYLRKSKTGFTTMNVIIDILVLYTVETGIVTCAATIVSLICWLTLPSELIYLGLHFSISKLYANTFLATLNSRATLRARSMSGSNPEPPSLPPLFNDHPHRSHSSGQSPRGEDPNRLQLQITVEKTVERDVERPGVKHVELRTRTRDEEATPVEERPNYICATSSRSGGSYQLW